LLTLHIHVAFLRDGTCILQNEQAWDGGEVVAQDHAAKCWVKAAGPT